MQLNQIEQRMNDFRSPSWRLSLFILPALLLLAVLGDWLLGWRITGFFSYTSTVIDNSGAETVTIPGKTLWDVFELLLLPSVVIGSAVLFAWVYRQTQLAIAADHQAQTDILNEKEQDRQARLAQQQQDDGYLQQYFAFITDLLLHRGLKRAKPDSDVAQVARVRTVIALSSLGQDHRGKIIQFLYEAGLIYGENTVISLAGVDLGQAELSTITLKDANLQGVNLQKANLQQANLSGAFLEGANLAEVNLLEAELEGATYDQTTVWPADFNPDEN